MSLKPLLLPAALFLVPMIARGDGDLYTFNTGVPFILANSPVTAPAFAVTVAGEPYRDVPRGDTLVLELDVAGAVEPIAYQWYRDLGAKMPFPLPNADGSTLILEDVTSNDAGAYWCEVTSGATTVPSNAVIVTVVTPMPLSGVAVVLLALGIAGAAALRRKKIGAISR